MIIEIKTTPPTTEPVMTVAWEVLKSTLTVVDDDYVGSFSVIFLPKAGEEKIWHLLVYNPSDTRASYAMFDLNPDKRLP